jgi:hypothetical protein
MYKGFFEDVEYVMGLFFKPFEDCSQADDEDEEEEKKCGMGCDDAVCFRDHENKDREEDDGKACDFVPCMKDEATEDMPKNSPPEGGLLGPGPVQDILKCLFDASDIDYDYED